MPYTKRTCHECGRRDIQPNMIRATREIKVGRSRTGATIWTWVSAALGHKPSQRALKRFLFNSSQRTYFREKQIWICYKCEGEE